METDLQSVIKEVHRCATIYIKFTTNSFTLGEKNGLDSFYFSADI